MTTTFSNASRILKDILRVSQIDVSTVVCLSLILCTQPALAEDTTNPTIKGLVGLKVPPKTPGGQQGELPGWHDLGGPSVATTKYTMYVENGYIGGESGFLLIQLDKDKARTVVDARNLPIDLLRYEIAGEKHVWRKNAINRYNVERCEKAGTTDAIIGLMRPEQGKEGCLHNSRQVKTAWRVNEMTKKLEDISPKGITCFFPDGEDTCNN